jgi:hypothetical protein
MASWTPPVCLVFLVERGVDLDPHDGLVMLRRARPRAYHSRWRGSVRRAQDHFDAADLIRRFLLDVDGSMPPGPKYELMDGRQNERASLFGRGPATRWTNKEVVTALQEDDLYPHGVHVVHEGASERYVVETSSARCLAAPPWQKPASPISRARAGRAYSPASLRP